MPNTTTEKTPYKATRIAVFSVAVVFFVLMMVAVCVVPFKFSTTAVFVNIGIDLLGTAIVLVLTGICFLDKQRLEKNSLIYLFMLLFVMLFFVTDVATYCMDGRAKFRIINLVTVAICYSVAPLLSLLFWFYQNALYKGHTKANRVASRIIVALTVLDMLWVFVGGFTGLVYAVSPDGIYETQSLYWTTNIVPALVLLTCFFVNIPRNIPMIKKYALIVYCLLPIIAGVVSVFVAVRFVYFFVTVGLVLLFGTFHIDRGIEIVERDKELMQKEQELMMSQIQPHFLYNTLNSIYVLCKGNSLAQKTIKDFSDYLRRNLSAVGTKLAPVEEELKHVGTYLEIEKLRFGDRLSVEYDIQDTKFSIPPLSVQPIVENAVKHGICKKEKGGTVVVSTYLDGEYHVVKVSDDGVGFDANKTFSSKHIGISNVQKRIETICQGTMTILSKEGFGTEVFIKIPVNGGNNERISG